MGLKEYLSSNKNWENLKCEERRGIAVELRTNGMFDRMVLHDIEDMLRINEVRDDLAGPFKIESLDESDKKRQKTERMIRKVLY